MNSSIEKMIYEHNKHDVARFNMPGHKGVLNKDDITEIIDGDNLNAPKTYIKDAMQYLSTSNNSEHSYFLVNGATCGIHCMIKYASYYKNSPIIIPRNSHMSVFNGCALYNIDVVIVENEYNIELECYEFSEENYINAIKENPQCSSIFITSPDYFGRVPNIENIAKVARENNMLILCDEAHGAHFRISEKLPNSVSEYADIWVQSPHKTLCAYTQGAYLHINTSIDNNRIEYLLKALQTSSPNTLLIESLDKARITADNGAHQYNDRINQINKLSQKINKLDGIKVCDEKWAKSTNFYHKDITRLVIDVSQKGSGLDIFNYLWYEYRIHFEMATFKYLVAIMTPLDDIEWDKRLFIALEDISKNTKFKKQSYNINLNISPIRKISIYKALNTKGEYVLFDDAINKISLNALGTYPPGSPIVLPGEVINEQSINYLKSFKMLGASIFGEVDDKIFVKNN